MTRKKEQEYIGLDAAARILRIGNKTLLEGLKNGSILLEFSKFDTVYRFRRKEVEDLFKKSFKTFAQHKNLKTRTKNVRKPTED
jgi:hypothetical protein